MLLLFAHVQVEAMWPIMQNIRFLDFFTYVHVTFNVFKVFHIIALNLSLRRFITTSDSYAKIIFTSVAYPFFLSIN